MIDIQRQVEELLKGEIKWSVPTDKLKFVECLIQRFVGGNYYLEAKRNGRYTQISCKAMPCWLITHSDLRRLKKLDRQLGREKLLKERDRLREEAEKIERLLQENE